MAIDIEKAWDYNKLYDWYISSVDHTEEPVWTPEHIEELTNDFYVIPKIKKGTKRPMTKAETAKMRKLMETKEFKADMAWLQQKYSAFGKFTEEEVQKDIRLLREMHYIPDYIDIELKFEGEKLVLNAMTIIQG